MLNPRACKICGREFIPDKFHPSQIYCSLPGCQRERRRKYQKKYGRVWRRRNPSYHKDYYRQSKQIMPPA